MKRAFFVLGFALAWSGTAQAQTDLFTSIGSDTTGGDPPAGIAAIYPVVLALEDLAANPSQVAIDLPGYGVVVADRTLFDPRIGFDETGVPLEGTVLEDWSFLWRGRTSEGFDAVLTVLEGQLAGQVIGPHGNYSISRNSVGVDHLYHLLETPVEEEPPLVAPATAGLTPLELLERYAERIDPKVYAALKAGQALPERIYVDALQVYTEQARIDAGGDPGIPYDDRGIRAQIVNGVDGLNTALDNSLVNAEMRIVQFSRLTGFTPTGISFADLATLKNNQTIQSLRNASGADIVLVTIRNTGPLVVNCGYAYVQRPGCGDMEPIEGCDVGQAFRDFSIAWVAQNCIQYATLAHESGHLAGCEHDPEHLYDIITPDKASRPYSFGHSVNEPGAQFRTVMAIVAPPRVLNFSNPFVLIGGYPTGIAAARHNARTLEIFLVVLATFNPPQPSYIFGDGFESGGLENWSTVTGP